jgi:predicted esterase
MQKHNIEVVKTARYFSLGTLNSQTKKIIFALHGYAQTADNFLETLKCLENEETYIIAPEGLSRFYWKDFISNPVASWMTKLDREDDIKDSLSYLNKLYKEVVSGLNLDKVTIEFFGFSQGAATMSRWLAQDTIMVQKAIFYAGEIAHDIDFSKSENFNSCELVFVYGNKDRFINGKKLESMKQQFDQLNILLKIVEFEGKHEVIKNGLVKI